MKKHKKKRHSKSSKKDIKKRISKKKLEPKKKSKIGIFLIVALIIILFSINFLKTPAKKIVVIENLTFSETDYSNLDLFSFYVRNDHEEHADCYFILSFNDEITSWNGGIIKAQSTKQSRRFVFIPNGTSDITLNVECQWSKDIDISGCEGSTFKICSLVKEDAKLKQCLNRFIPEQYFCIALLKNDASYCDDIKIIPLQTRCRAFIENNPKLCENLRPGPRDWCYQDYGINKMDKEVCEKIINEDKKNSCLGAATLDVELCRDVNERDKFRCIVNMAEFMGNKGLCELLINKEGCYEELSWME